MARLVRLTAVTVALLAMAAAAVDVSTLKSVFAFQVQSDTTLQGAAVSVVDGSSFRSQLSGAFGYADRAANDPMMLDSMFRANTVSGTLVVAAALKLVASSVLPSIDSTIPTTYLPGQVSLINSNFPTTPITLRMLMTHTSTLSDASFETARRTSPSAVVDMRAFVTSSMITSSGGVSTLSSAIFTLGAATPGSSAAYNYARINTALLTFIIEMAVIANPSLISGNSYTALAYVREQILSPLGMADTITLTLTGGFPTLSYPTLGSAFTDRVVADLSSAGTSLTSRSIHPAYFSDYMTYTSSLDLARFVRSLFLSSSTATATNLASIGLSMRTRLVVSGGVTAMTATGLGIQYFDGAVMCASAIATGAVTKCPLTAAHNVWGFVSSGQFSLVGFYCTDAVATSPTCVTTAHTYNDVGSAGTKPVELSHAMAAAALQLAIGDTSLVTQSTVSSDTRSDLYGLYVSFGVLGVLAFVFVASLATEAIIQPAPVTNGVPVPQSMMPQHVARIPTDNYMNSN